MVSESPVPEQDRAPDPAQLRPAATLILTRHGPQGPAVLMGQRGAAAAFMPSKFVFPGGAVDAADAQGSTPAAPLAPLCAARLAQSGLSPAAVTRAALRELAEETGLQFPPGAARLRYVFRAITPPGRSRRFDAHFFLADAAALSGDPDDFSAAEDELSHLHWTPLAAARALDLPFVTEVVLAEVSALLAGGSQPGVPFFDNSGAQPAFRRIL